LLTINTQKLSDVIEIAFQSSLEREEDRFHHFSLIILPPQKGDEINQLYVFDRWQDLIKLPKIASSTENTNQKFCVWFSSEGKPQIWAFGNIISDYLCLKISTFSAGQIIVQIPYIFYSSTTHFVVSLLRTGFINKTSIFNDIFSQSNEFNVLANFFDNLKGKISLNKFDGDILTRQFYRILNDTGCFEKIANKMRQHSHGGTLLVIPDTNNSENSFQQPMSFRAKTTYRELRKNIQKETDNLVERVKQKQKPSLLLDASQRISFDEKIKLLDLIGQLTSVDGATVITRDFDVIAFGVKIKPIKPNDKPDKIIVLEPFEDSKEEYKELFELGGTRHQSAAQFVYDQKNNSFAIVASQDGRISVMYWDIEREKVRIIKHAEFLFV